MILGAPRAIVKQKKSVDSVKKVCDAKGKGLFSARHFAKIVADLLARKKFPLKTVSDATLLRCPETLTLIPTLLEWIAAEIRPIFRGRGVRAASRSKGRY